jgi:hypothetical protein
MLLSSALGADSIPSDATVESLIKLAQDARDAAALALHYGHLDIRDAQLAKATLYQQQAQALAVVKGITLPPAGTDTSPNVKWWLLGIAGLAAVGGGVLYAMRPKR